MNDQPIYYAWHNDQALRDATIAKLHEHRAQERFIQGAYSQGSDDDWKGCWYGCLTGEPIEVHQFAYDKFGIHPCVGSLIEHCYEHLPANVAVDTVLKLTESIPVGADLRVIYSRWVCDWLAPKLRKMANINNHCRVAIEGVERIFANDAWPAADADYATAYPESYPAAYAAARAAAHAAYAAYAAADAAYYAAVHAAHAAHAVACAAARATAREAADAADATREAARATAREAADAADAAHAATWQSLADWLLSELPKCPCPGMEVTQ